MKIIDIWPSREGSSSIAKFDLELTPKVRIFGLHLRRNADGNLRAFAPKSGGKHAVSFNSEISEQITLAAAAAWKGHSLNVTNR